MKIIRHNTIINSSLAIIMLLSITKTLIQYHENDLIIIPEWDLSRCPPITSNSKRIWAYWHTGTMDMPLFIEQNIRLWKQIAPDWEIRVIEGFSPERECHYTKFLNPEYIPKTISTAIVQKQADAVRLGLIRQYGGVYMDASVVLMQPLDRIWEELNLPPEDPNFKAIAGYFSPWFSLPNMKNGFEISIIIAKANEHIMVQWHDLYLELVKNSMDPFIRDERTNYLNPLLQGADLSKLDSFFINYGASTTCLNALLQKNVDLYKRWEEKGEILESSRYPFGLWAELGWSEDRLYEYFFNPRMLHPNRIKHMIDLSPFLKITGHAKWIKDSHYDYWNDLRNNMGFARIGFAKKAKMFKLIGKWDDKLFY